MILNLFRARTRELFFSDLDWKQEQANRYSLTLEMGKTKITASTRFMLCILQSGRYRFFSEGSETIVGTSLMYVSHFPFSGKVSVK